MASGRVGDGESAQFVDRLSAKGGVWRVLVGREQPTEAT
jgi:hypothetical protein